MTGRAKPSPLQAFEDNMADAHHLVRLAEGLTNERSRRMRRELRDRVGSALRVVERDQGELDCLESDDVFMVFLPGSWLHREDFLDHRPLLRQALVAGCAATETYLADKVMTRVGDLLTSDDAATDRMKKLPMSVGEWLYIERRYERRRRGLRERVVKPYVRENASTAPNKVGEMLSLIGVVNWTKQVDAQRASSRGDTERLLERVTQRRNKIAHQGDRQGFGRAALSIEETKVDLADLKSVVLAIEAVVT